MLIGMVIVCILNTGGVLLCLQRYDTRAYNDAGLLLYDNYRLRWQQKALYLILAGSAGWFIGYTFYRLLPMQLLFSSLAGWSLLWKRKQLIESRRRLLTLQFRDAIYVISTALSVGKSLMSAIKDAAEDLGKLYFGEQAYMVHELNVMDQRLAMSASIEAVFQDFAERANIEDIHQFTEVLLVGRKRGANLIELIRRTSQMIGDKIQTQQEITTILSGKRYEVRIMTGMPIFFVYFLEFSSPELMAPIYTTFLGHMVMTVALIIFGSAFILAEKMVCGEASE
jgi:tight adherence protein B